MSNPVQITDLRLEDVTYLQLFHVEHLPWWAIETEKLQTPLLHVEQFLEGTPSGRQRSECSTWNNFASATEKDPRYQGEHATLNNSVIYVWKILATSNCSTWNNSFSPQKPPKVPRGT